MKKSILILISATVILFACKKEAGEGGTSKLKGNVIVENFSTYNSSKVSTINAADEDVYIIYGDNDFYSDKVKTDDKGYYEFNGLQKGDYKIYVFSELTEEEKTAVYKNVNIESNSSETNIDDIIISKFVSDGNSSVTGRLFIYDYNSELTTLKDTFYGADRYVYFALKDNETYIDRVKTNPDGYFVFTEVLPGDYEVYAYSKTTASAGTVAIKKYFTVENNEDVVLPRIEIID